MFHAPAPTQVPSSSQMLASLSSSATKAGVELFKAYGIELKCLRKTGKVQKLGDVAFLSLAGFSGPQYSGFIGLGISQILLRRSNQTTSSSYDWMAELANQFIGRVKNHLLRQGIAIYRTPPAVVEGYPPALFYLLADFKPVTLADETDSVFIWMKSEPSLGDHDASPAACGDVLQEGELLLF